MVTQRNRQETTHDPRFITAIAWQAEQFRKTKQRKSGLLKMQTNAEHNLKTLRKMVKNTTRHRFTELWEEVNENYTLDRKRQGELAKAAIEERGEIT